MNIRIVEKINRREVNIKVKRKEDVSMKVIKWMKGISRKLEEKEKEK